MHSCVPISWRWPTDSFPMKFLVLGFHQQPALLPLQFHLANVQIWIFRTAELWNVSKGKQSHLGLVVGLQQMRNWLVIFPQFSSRKRNIPDFGPSTICWNISFVTIEFVLMGCPAEVCTFAAPTKPALYVRFKLKLSTIITKVKASKRTNRPLHCAHKDNQRKADIQTASVVISLLFR